MKNRNKKQKGGRRREMINRTKVYIILWKQYWQKNRFLIILMFLTAFFFGLERSGKVLEDAYGGIAIGVCGEDEKGWEFISRLEKETGIFRFHEFEDEAEMLRLIENGTLECGYVMPEGFYDRILKGKMNRQVILYYSPASSAHKISYEVIFADLFEMLSEDILEKYLQDNGPFPGMTKEEAKEKLLALNEAYAEGGNTFQFVYEMVGKEKKEGEKGLDTLRGCVAVMALAMSLFGLANVLGLANVWGALPENLRKTLQSQGIHTAVAGSVLTGGICLWLSGSMERSWREAAGLLLYFIILEIFVRVLGRIIRNDKALYGLIPALIMGSLLFCPVFIRIERYLPAIKWISGLFPATYYLNYMQ